MSEFGGAKSFSRKYAPTSDDFDRDGNDDWRCEECDRVVTSRLNPVTCYKCGGDMLRAPQVRVVAK